MSSPREVRVDPRFLDQLDQQLGKERGLVGQPSATDFLLVDLPPIAAEFSLNFDALPILISGRSDYRVVIASGRLVPRLAVIGQLLGNGVVMLIGVDLDMESGW